MNVKRIAVIVAAVGLALCGYAADEINANLVLKVKKGSLDIQRAANQTLTLIHGNPNVAGFTQLVPTNSVGTALDLGNVATNGVAWFRNLSTNNYIEVGVQDANTNFLALIRLEYGEAWTVRIARGVTPYARANTASVVLEKLIFDN